MPASTPPLLVRNGEVHPTGLPLLSADDGLAAYGLGAFETLAAYRGRLFLVESHLARLRHAAGILRLPCPEDVAWRESMDAALAANQLQTADKARIRLTLSSPTDRSPSWWVEANLPPPHPPAARAVTGSDFVRNERSPLAGLKSTHCGDSILAQRFAHAAGADEALFANTRGELCEGAWSNVFVKLDGRWFTPPLESGCLPGVTRALVLDLFHELGIEAEEAPLPINRLDEVESAFLTSSLREIQPLSAIDGRGLAIPTLLSDLQAAYRRRTEAA